MKNYTDKQLSEDIYDLIKACALPEGQNDEWAKLSRKHAEEARKNIGKYLKSKNVEWNGDNKSINIGKHITIFITKY